MKLVSYKEFDREQLGLIVDDYIYPPGVNDDLPHSMNELLQDWDKFFLLLKERKTKIEKDSSIFLQKIKITDALLLAPVPHPASCRDAYAFRQHVAAARRNRNVPMIPEFDEYPIFYFTNHHSIKGPGEIYCMPDHLQKLDFELEAAIVICKHGTNIKAEEADEYIGGLMIMNDLSARKLQAEEMLLNLGPAKGKDFATAVGPWLVTPDELTSFEIPAKENHVGKSWNLKMTCKVNGLQVSEGNLGDMDWTFAEIIERASYGAELYPGDIIGSGTVGTGCFLELNGTGKLNDPNYREQWLQNGDVVELEIEQLGSLTNTIVAQQTSWSILSKKKKPYDAGFTRA